MQAAPAPVKHPLPTRIQQAILAYGFADTQLLQKVVAHREHGTWYAVLVEDPEEGFWAVELEWIDNTWEVVNDYSGPFDSVSDFHNKRLVTCFR